MQEVNKMKDNEKIVLTEKDIFGIYKGEDAKAELTAQMCNCCQTCKAGKC